MSRYSLDKLKCLGSPWTIWSPVYCGDGRLTRSIHPEEWSDNVAEAGVRRLVSPTYTDTTYTDNIRVERSLKRGFGSIFHPQNVKVDCIINSGSLRWKLWWEQLSFLVHAVAFNYSSCQLFANSILVMAPPTAATHCLLHELWNRRLELSSSASKMSIQRFVITEKAPTRVFSWLKAATTAFTFKTILRNYAKWALTPWSFNVKLGPQRKDHKGQAGRLA